MSWRKYRVINNSTFSKFFLMLLFLACLCVFTNDILGANLFVNDSGDSIDDVPGNGVCADIFGRCTLRAAIEEANVLSGDDIVTFNLPTPATVTITLGQLRIPTNIAITGLGTRQLTVRRSSASGTPDFGLFSFVFFSQSSISNLTISNGKTSAGGGIQVGGDARLDLSSVAITGNTATLSGSGGGIDNGGTLNMINSIVDANIANSGAGIRNRQGGPSGGFANIANTTITNNTASGDSVSEGGGIYNSASVVLNNVTISNNSAEDAAGGIRNLGGIKMRNTIVANNTAPTNPDVFGSFCALGNHSLGNNLVQNGSGSTCLINGLDGDIIGSVALLGNLQDNGGATNTFRLLAGSPALNAGNNCVLNSTCPDSGAVSTNPIVQLTFDQRGLPRPVGERVDIGAFEAQPFAVGIRGRTLMSSGEPVRNAFIYLTDSVTSETRITLANPFGYYRFLNVQTGRTYTLSVRHKRLTFTPQTMTIQSERNDLDLVGTR